MTCQAMQIRRRTQAGERARLLGDLAARRLDLLLRLVYVLQTETK